MPLSGNASIIGSAIPSGNISFTTPAKVSPSRNTNFYSTAVGSSGNFQISDIGDITPSLS